MHRAIETSGGLYVVPASADPQAVRGEILERGIRALELQAGCDTDFLRGLPLEFLIVGDAGPVDAIATLRDLRGLHVGSWDGRLDFDALPALEWFGTTEIQRGQLEPLLEGASLRLHHLAVGRYRFADAAPLRPLTALTHLAIGDTRALVSLEGVGEVPGLRHLSLYACPGLDRLAGLEAACDLQHLELESCNRIGDLSALTGLTALRSLKVQMRAPPSLAGVVGHQALEYLWIVSAKWSADEIVPLLDLPRLRFLAAGRSRWLRTASAWEHVPDIYAMTEPQGALHDQRMDEWNTAAAW